MSEPVELFPLAYGDHRMMMMARRTLTAQYSRKMNVVRDGFIYMDIFAGCWFPPSLQREKNVLIPIAS